MIKPRAFRLFSRYSRIQRRVFSKKEYKKQKDYSKKDQKDYGKESNKGKEFKEFKEYDEVSSMQNMTQLNFNAYIAAINEKPEHLDEVLPALNENARVYLQEKLSVECDFGDISMPSNRQLFLLGLQASIPMIGFGFLDNFLMIVLGAQIEATFGVFFGISVMASAACGNTISDMGGVVMGSYVEILAEKLNIPKPRLNEKQRSYGRAKFASAAGGMAGVGLGCILGMVPLLFYTQETDKTVIANIFKKIDANGDGCITANELHLALEDIGVQISEERISYFLKKYDINGSGTLEFEELICICEDMGLIEIATDRMELRKKRYANEMAEDEWYKSVAHAN